MEAIQAVPVAVAGPAVALGGLTLWFIKAYANDQKKKSANLPPEVPGWPVIGNLLQLKEKKPHRTFTKWAETYGPIYSIRTGASKMVVLNANDVAKEAMVTKYSSISTRKLSKALNILTNDKRMVAMSDYNEFYKEAKKILMTSTLGSHAQKKLRVHRDQLVENISAQFQQCCVNSSSEVVNFRSTFQPELFSLSVKEAIGKDIESIYIEELGGVIEKHELFKILVQDQMEGAIEVDWRDFFPYLKWIPNNSFEAKIQLLDKRREIVMKALMNDHKKTFKIEQEGKCYLDFLLKEGNAFTEKQVLMLAWETIIEASDTTMVLTEWAMYELAKNRDKQDRLYAEIQKVCGENKVTEENLCQLPYLAAIFQETLRLHCPVPIVPLRYVHEDTELGGYNVPSGTEIAINIYGCNMDKNVWESPDEWKPERFVNGKSETMELHKIAAFGGGKRACAGALQAMLISCISIASLVQQFEWRLLQGEEDDVDTMGLTNQKLHPLQAIIRPRT